MNYLYSYSYPAISIFIFYTIFFSNQKKKGKLVLISPRKYSLWDGKVKTRVFKKKKKKKRKQINNKTTDKQ
jgi:hypothetical protein